MGGKVARLAVFALAFGLALAYMRCTMQVVNSQTATVRSDTAGLTTKLDFESEPTPDRPVASFRAYRTAFVNDTRLRTTQFRYRPAPLAWATTIGAFLAGGVTDWRLAGSGHVVLGRDIVAVSAVPLMGLALVSLGTYRRSAILIDTSRFTTPLPVAVKCGTAEVATLYPDGNGVTELRLKDHLSFLPVLSNDTSLTISLVGTQGPSRCLSLTRAAYAAAIEAHRVDLEQEARVERERKAAIERAKQDSIAEERERRKAEEQAEKARREQQQRVAAALDNVVASLDEWDRAQLVTQFKYADAGFQYLAATGNIAKALEISSYGDFLDLPLRTQIWAVREIVRAACGEVHGLQASLVLQQLLHIPAYLAEKILR